jgi:hypothetical protein
MPQDAMSSGKEHFALERYRTNYASARSYRLASTLVQGSRNGGSRWLREYKYSVTVTVTVTVFTLRSVTFLRVFSNLLSFLSVKALLPF